MEPFDDFNGEFGDNGDNGDFDVVFEEDDFSKKLEIKQTPTTPDYDEDTTEKYRVLRLRKMDPISFIELDEEYAFKFHHIWDPYTGERLNEKDSNGPLYFDPDIIIKHFHTKRIDKLWVEPKDDSTGFYEGYYDDGVGAGEDFFVGGRGHHPEWYLFRLPIIDCYLTKSNNNQFITFGPKLTDNEIKEIQRLAEKKPDNYKRQFGYNRPSLIEMKKLYDIAISKTPNWPELNLNSVDGESKESIYTRMNREAVNRLVHMRG